MDKLAEVAPINPMIVPKINPYFLPIFFIKREAGRPDSIVPIR